MATATPTVRAECEQAIRSTLGSLRLDGLEPPPEAHAITERFANGEFTLEQMDSAFEDLMAQNMDP